MDPNAAWKMRKEHLEAGNYSEAHEVATALREWVRSGGFPPRGVSRQACLYGCRLAIEACKPFVEA